MSENTPIASFRDLTVWKRSIYLVKEIYRITSTFPAEGEVRSYESDEKVCNIHYIQYC
jgi:hypothetical protein